VQLLCCSKPRTCIIIFYQYSLHWNWCTCWQSCYRRFKIFDELLCDTMRLEKTPTAYLFMCIYALWAYTHMKIHQSILLLCLSDVMISEERWRVISELTIVLAYGDKLKNIQSWIELMSQHSREPAELHWMIISNQLYVRHHWPSSFQSCSSYKLWYVNHSHCEDKKTQLISEGFKEIQILYSDWSEMIALIVMNEGHHLRNLKIKAHVSVWDLNCDHHWFLTVTSSINTLLIS
jgi:hypothetical protein